MKKRLLTIMAVGLAFVLLTSLSFVTAPVSALSQPDVSITPNIVGVSADYTIIFTINNELSSGDTITITFPGDTSLGAINAVIAAGPGWIGEVWKNPTLTSSNWTYNATATTVTYTLDPGDEVGQSAQILFEITGGITNPSVPGIYTLTVHTSQETTPRESEGYILQRGWVSSKDATNIGTSSATLNGNLDSLDGHTTMYCSFAWGTTSGGPYPNETSLQAMTSTGPFSENISGLLPSTTYYFIAKAADGLTDFGAELFFYTRSNPDVFVTPYIAGVTANYIIYFELYNELSSGDTITIAFPEDTSLGAIIAAIAASPGWVGGSWEYPTLTSSNWTYNATARTVTYTLDPGDEVGESAQVRIEITGGIINPSIPGIYTLTVHTNQEPTPLESESYIIVTGAEISGTTYEASGSILGGVFISINGGIPVISAGDGTYQIFSTTTGNHTITASKAGFRDQIQVIEITDIGIPYFLDFKGNNGLVPDAPDISYVLACINKWIAPPGDGTGLNISKVLSVINAWKFPTNPETGDWYIDTVDIGTDWVGYGTSIAIDSVNRPHIAYGNNSNDSVKYTHWDGSSWQIQTVENATSKSFYSPSLALDNQSRPHICYVFTEAGLKYAYWNGLSWQITTIDNMGIPITSITLDINIPHIVYARSDSSLYHTSWNGTTWQNQEIESGGIYSSVSLGLDHSAIPHISYMYNNTLKYASWNGSGWQIQTLASKARDCSLALDSTDRPHIVYLDATDGLMKHIYFDGLIWVVESVDNIGSHYEFYADIAIDAEDGIHIGYYVASSGTLKYAYKYQSGWQTEIIDTGDLVGQFPSIALNGIGNPYISYTRVESTRYLLCAYLQ